MDMEWRAREHQEYVEVVRVDEDDAPPGARDVLTTGDHAEVMPMHTGQDVSAVRGFGGARFAGFPCQ